MTAILERWNDGLLGRWGNGVLGCWDSVGERSLVISHWSLVAVWLYGCMDAWLHSCMDVGMVDECLV
jgi:hypothetical protein